MQRSRQAAEGLSCCWRRPATKSSTQDFCEDFCPARHPRHYWAALVYSQVCRHKQSKREAGARSARQRLEEEKILSQQNLTWYGLMALIRMLRGLRSCEQAHSALATPSRCCCGGSWTLPALPVADAAYYYAATRLLLAHACCSSPESLRPAGGQLHSQGTARGQRFFPSKCKM